MQVLTGNGSDGGAAVDHQDGGGRLRIPHQPGHPSAHDSAAHNQKIDRSGG